MYFSHQEAELNPNLTMQYTQQALPQRVGVAVGEFLQKRFTEKIEEPTANLRDIYDSRTDFVAPSTISNNSSTVVVHCASTDIGAGLSIRTWHLFDIVSPLSSSSPSGRTIG